MRKILLTLLTFMGLLLSSCQNTERISGEPEKEGTIENSFMLDLKIPGTRANSYSRVTPVEIESDIYSLHLMFFARTSDGSGEYKGHYSVKIDEDSPLNIEYPVEVLFDEESQLSNKEAYSILLVANLDWFLKDMTIEDWIESIKSMTEKEAKDKTRAYVQGEEDETIYINGLDRVPMSTVTQKEALVTRVEAILDRTVARIDIISYMGEKFDLVSTSIWNAFPYSSIWEGDVDYNEARIQRFYGMLTQPNSNGQLNAIEGGLYAFENYVEEPQAYDLKTTCVIIGLRNLDPSSPDYGIVVYYRINIRSNGTAQNIQRNSSYSITIRGVLDRGYMTELEAYLGEIDKLDFVINFWDLDDDGLILYDGDNVLAVPMKRINIPREGDEREYSVFTLGEGIPTISRNTLPAGIEASLRGNMLYVNSQPLAFNQVSRTGEIDIKFGTLVATVHINQSGEFDDDYLKLSPATIKVFPAYGKATSETITVNAIGEWTAKIYNEGFSFDANSLVTEFSSSQGDSFTITTTGSNPDNSSRVGFLIVSLDDNTEYNRSIVLQQRGKGGISLTPQVDVIYFNPDGELMSGYVNTFSVNPGDDGYGVINPWQVEIVDKNNFEISDYNYSPNNLSANTFTVRAKNRNTGTGSIATSVRVYITDEPSISQRMNIIQIAYILSVSPTQFNTVPAAGAKLGPIKVKCTQELTWTAKITTSTDGDGHSASLVNASGVASTQLSGTNQEEFYIDFPRLTKPNKNPEATISVTLNGTDHKVIFTVSQKKLEPRQLRFNSKGISYGTLYPGVDGYKYINVLGDNLYNQSYFGPSSTSVVQTAGPIQATHGYSKPINSAITNFHANQGCHSYRQAIVDWLGKDHRNFLSMSLETEQADQQGLLRLLSKEFTVANAAVNMTTKRSLSQTPQQHRNNKVWEYLVKTGPFTNGEELNVNNTFFYNGDAVNGCLTSWPSTTIPIIMHPTKSGACMLAIDPALKVVIIGDTEMFCRRNSYSNANDFTPGTDNFKFLNNLIAFMVNAGMYGDDFLNEFR